MRRGKRGREGEVGEEVALCGKMKSVALRRIVLETNGQTANVDRRTHTHTVQSIGGRNNSGGAVGGFGWGNGRRAGAGGRGRRP